MPTYVESWLPGARPMDREEIAASTDVPALKSRLTYLFNAPPIDRAHMYSQQDQIGWLGERLEHLTGRAW